jgi:hypothetical protein
LKNSDRLTHEHMVPGAVVLRALTELAPREPVLPVREALSFRALVSTAKRTDADRPDTDAYLLDYKVGMKSTLPGRVPDTLARQGFRAVSEVPLPLWPVMRYDAAGLLHKLLPVTERARVLLAAYASVRPDQAKQGRRSGLLRLSALLRPPPARLPPCSRQNPPRQAAVSVVCRPAIEPG